MFLRLRFYSQDITTTIFFSIKRLLRVQVFQGPGPRSGCRFRSSQDKQVYVTTKKLSEETEQNPSESYSLAVLFKVYP